LGLRGEPESARLQIVGQQFWLARLMDGRPPVRKARHDVRIFVDRRHGVAQLSETHRRDQPRVAGAEASELQAQAGSLRPERRVLRRIRVLLESRTYYIVVTESQQCS